MGLRDLAGPVMQVAGVATGQPWLTAAGTAMSGYAQNVASARAAQQQMDFQAEMSNTSYQRQVKDLEAAGINPMLVTKLGGASTPPGAMPSFVNPAFMASQASSAMQSSQAAKQQADTAERMSESQIQQVNAATDKIREEIKNIQIEGQRLKEMVYLVARQTDYYQHLGYSEAQRTNMVKATIQKLIAETDLIKFDVQAAQQLDNLGREVKQLEPIVNIIKALIGRR